MPRDKPFPRWVRALGEIFRPIRTVTGTAKLGAVVLGLLGVGVLWKQALLGWAKADPYHVPFIAVCLLFLFAYVAIYSLLREKDESSAVHASIRVLRFEILDNLPTYRVNPSTNEILVGEPRLTAPDVLVIRFEVTFRNDGDQTRAILSDLTLKPGRFRLELQSVVERDPMRSSWTGEEKVEIPSRDEKAIELFVVGTLQGGTMDVYRKKLRGAQMRARIVGQPQEVLQIVRPSKPLSVDPLPPKAS